MQCHNWNPYLCAVLEDVDAQETSDSDSIWSATWVFPSWGVSTLGGRDPLPPVCNWSECRELDSLGASDPSLIWMSLGLFPLVGVICAEVRRHGYPTIQPCERGFRWTCSHPGLPPVRKQFAHHSTNLPASMHWSIYHWDGQSPRRSLHAWPKFEEYPFCGGGCSWQSISPWMLEPQWVQAPSYNWREMLKT